MNDPETIVPIRRDEAGRVVMLDQRLLPTDEVYRTYETCAEVARGIRDLVIRGAGRRAARFPGLVAALSGRSPRVPVPFLGRELSSPVGLAAGMEHVGQLYANQEYFVPEVLMCSDALYAGLDILKPHVSGKEADVRGQVVIGTVGERFVGRFKDKAGVIRVGIKNRDDISDLILDLFSE